MRNKALGIIVAAMLLGGCVTQKPYVKTNVTNQEMKADLFQCKRCCGIYAERPSSLEADPYKKLGDTLIAIDMQRECMKECMESKGYAK